LPKYRCAAVSTPNDWLPSAIWFRYSSRIFSFEYFASIARATFASLSLRTSDFSRESRSGKMLRASCMVMVEKPSEKLRVLMSAQIARGMLLKSTPLCS
jgi:hypothetical protein